MSLGGWTCAFIPGPCWSLSVSRPLNTVYARVRDEDLGELRHWVTLCTLLNPTAVLSTARLPSRIQELSLMAVRAQVEVQASKVGICLLVLDSKK